MLVNDTNPSSAHSIRPSSTSSRTSSVGGAARTAARAGQFAIDETTATPICLALDLLDGAEEARNSGQHQAVHRSIDGSIVLRLNTSDVHGQHQEVHVQHQVVHGSLVRVLRLNPSEVEDRTPRGGRTGCCVVS